MGKAFISLGGVAVMLFIGYATVPSNSWAMPVLWYAFVVFGILSLVAGAIRLCFFLKMRLKPLTISDNAHCAYLATEKELQLNWVFCSYSASSTFRILCFARFGKQNVNVGIRSLVATRDPNAECVNGTRWVIEGLARNVEVQAPEKCLLEIKMKPYGRFWAWTKKLLEVETLVIRH